MILYYPIREYTDLLEDDTPFALINEIMVPGATDPKDRFMIWRLREGAMTQAGAVEEGDSDAARLAWEQIRS